MSAQPAALQLRLLQTVVAVAAEKNSTLVLPFPVELLRFLERAQQQPSGGGGAGRALRPVRTRCPPRPGRGPRPDRAGRRPRPGRTARGGAATRPSLSVAADRTGRGTRPVDSTAADLRR